MFTDAPVRSLPIAFASNYQINMQSNAQKGDVKGDYGLYGRFEAMPMTGFRFQDSSHLPDVALRIQWSSCTYSTVLSFLMCVEEVRARRNMNLNVDVVVTKRCLTEKQPTSLSVVLNVAALCVIVTNQDSLSWFKLKVCEETNQRRSDVNPTDLIITSDDSFVI